MNVLGFFWFLIIIYIYIYIYIFFFLKLVNFWLHGIDKLIASNKQKHDLICKVICRLLVLV